VSSWGDLNKKLKIYSSFSFPLRRRRVSLKSILVNGIIHLFISSGYLNFYPFTALIG